MGQSLGESGFVDDPCFLSCPSSSFSHLALILPFLPAFHLLSLSNDLINGQRLTPDDHRASPSARPDRD